MNDNPFSKKDGKPAPPVTRKPEELELQNVCPFMTSPTMAFRPSNKAEQMSGAGPVVPFLTAGLVGCVKEACMFWKKNEIIEGGACLIREGLAALVGATRPEVKA